MQRGSAVIMMTLTMLGCGHRPSGQTSAPTPDTLPTYTIPDTDEAKAEMLVAVETKIKDAEARRPSQQDRYKADRVQAELGRLYQARAALLAQPAPPVVGGELPPFTDRDRFPTLSIVNASLRFHVDARFTMRGKIVLEPARAEYWRRQLIQNDHTLRCWQALLEAQGGLAEEKGGRDDDEFCRAALARLRALLGEADYQVGKMP